MRTEVIGFHDFMTGDYKKKKKPTKKQVKKALEVGIAVTVGIVALGFGDVSYASAGAVAGVTAQKIVNAFQPVIDLVQGLSYPVGLVMMLGGGLSVMVGMQEKGFSMIQRAGIGYILIQMLPILMDLLVEVAKAF
ncbi:hypothetical protein [Cytobacillus praedii]|uniref:hypothetical protein n=1 Tax=Cytobacillus praedii TaxID=1742358 RepID=UPI002E1C16CA|nr:hypothetical protein [Cytobacillus praedii]